MKLSQKIEKINIPPVDPLIIQYVILASTHDKKKNQILSDMESLSQIIDKKIENFNAESESLNNRKKSLLAAHEKINLPRFPDPKYIWAKQKHHRLFLKYYKCVTDFYEEKIHISNLLNNFLKECFKKSLPIIVLKDKYMYNMDSENDPKINSSLRRYTIMTNYINSFEKHGLKKTCRYGDVIINDLWPKLKKVAAKYDNPSISDKERFYPPNEFEDMFMRFILINKISDGFKLCIERMPKYGTYETFKKNISQNLSFESEDALESLDKDNKEDEMSPNNVSLADLDKKEEESQSDEENKEVNVQKLSAIEESQLQAMMDQEMDTGNFRNFVLALFRLIKQNNPCTQAMLQLFHCAVIRILFDFYYIANSAILYGRQSKELYIEACQEILSLSPLQMNLNKKFFSPEEINIPMREIIINDPILLTGSANLYLIQFMIDPLDMAIQIHKAIKKIQESIDKKNSKGNHQTNQISKQMTSDDFIDMLKPLYAMNPFVCPSGVCRFIELFCELFQLFDTLSYSLTTFSIALKDIYEAAKKKENYPPLPHSK